MKKNFTLTPVSFILLFGISANAQNVTVLFTASGTFTVPACVTSVQVQSWGGGGGGGGSVSNPANNSGGGGGGGAYMLVASVPVVPGNTYNVVVGMGGTAAVGVSGGNGGASSFNGTAVANGGAGGMCYNNFFSAGNGAGGAGGTGGTYNGGNGHSGDHPDCGGGGGGGAGSGGNGGPGGWIVDCTGGVGGIGTNAGGVGGDGGTTDGLPGVAPGGGGGGSNTQNLLGGTSRSGGPGGNGQVIITYVDPSPVITSVTGGGCIGQTITVNGTNFSGTTSVTIGSTAVTNLIISPTVVSGTIAPGTTTGLVTITTPCGSDTYGSSFIVNQPQPPVNLGTQSFCAGGSFSFGGQSYTAAGTYYDTTASTITGCDSITAITLNVNSATTVPISQSICSGNSYFFHGQYLSNAGIYSDTTSSTVNGCDSITTLTLAVTSPSPQIVAHSICTGGSFTFNGTTYSVAGQYPDTLLGAGMNGCDSIVILDLAVNSFASSAISDSICTGATYNFNGTIISSAGTYVDTLAGGSVNGCDSIITLVLGIKSGSTSSVTASVSSPVICASDSSQICASAGFVSYLWNTADTGMCMFTSLAGNYYVTATDNNGCTATSNHVSVSVYAVPSVSITVNGDTLSSFGAVSYQWYYNGNLINGANDSVYVAGAPGNYTLEITDTNGCTALSLPVVISGIEHALSEAWSIYPNPFSTGNFILSVGNNFIGSGIEISDADGRIIFKSSIVNPKSEIQLNVSQGVYLLRISSPNGTVVKKLIRL